MQKGPLPGGVTLRDGVIVAECERCGVRLEVRVGQHTLAEFWDLMRRRGWRVVEPVGARDAEDCAVLCRDCTASVDDTSYRLTPRPAGGLG